MSCELAKSKPENQNQNFVIPNRAENENKILSFRTGQKTKTKSCHSEPGGTPGEEPASASRACLDPTCRHHPITEAFPGNSPGFNLGSYTFPWVLDCAYPIGG
jgi:hypothetical protein